MDFFLRTTTCLVTNRRSQVSREKKGQERRDVSAFSFTFVTLDSFFRFPFNLIFWSCAKKIVVMMPMIMRWNVAAADEEEETV